MITAPFASLGWWDDAVAFAISLGQISGVKRCVVADPIVPGAWLIVVAAATVSEPCS